MDASIKVVPDASKAGMFACAVGVGIGLAVPAVLPGVAVMCVMIFVLDL